MKKFKKHNSFAEANRLAHYYFDENQINLRFYYFSQHSIVQL